MAAETIVMLKHLFGDDRKQYIIKESAIVDNSNLISDSFIFSPPHESTSQNSNLWLEIHYHGLKWNGSYLGLIFIFHIDINKMSNRVFAYHIISVHLLWSAYTGSLNADPYIPPKELFTEWITENGYKSHNEFDGDFNRVYERGINEFKSKFGLVKLVYDIKEQGDYKATFGNGGEQIFDKQMTHSKIAKEMRDWIESESTDDFRDLYNNHVQNLGNSVAFHPHIWE